MNRILNDKLNKTSYDIFELLPFFQNLEPEILQL